MRKWMLLLVNIAVVVAAAGTIAGFTLGGTSDSGQNDLADTSNSSGDQPADGWTLVEAAGWSGGFSLWLPSGWQLNELQGIDSYVGEIVGGNALLTFDLGWYSSHLVNEVDPLFIVVYENIGGRRAKLVRPKDGTGELLTGVYFENFDSSDDAPPWGRTRLQISGFGLAPEQQDTAFAVFRTIRLIAPEDQLPSGSNSDITDPSGERLPIRQDDEIDRGDDNPRHKADTRGYPSDASEKLVEARAPVDEVEAIIRESFPPQYALRVVSGLRDGCAKFGHISLDSSGHTFVIDVFNLVPSDDDVACPATFGCGTPSQG